MINGSTQRRLSAWRPARHCPRSAVPAAWWKWLLNPGSLTHRLRRRCGGVFRVAVRRQFWGRPTPDERHLLGMAAAERALMREVHLLCGDTPWVYARTVMPVSALRGRQRRLSRLGNKPLGAALFADPGLQRGEVQVARIGREEALFGRALAAPPAEIDAIWGRRSVFRLRGSALLVSEIFLPALLQPEGRPQCACNAAAKRAEE